MKNGLYFNMRDVSSILVSMIQSIPSNWSYVDGTLTAPQSLIDSDGVARNTSIALRRSKGGHPTIEGYARQEEKVVPPDLYALLVEQKPPDSIVFDEATFGHSEISLFYQCRHTAEGLIRRGYRGSLHFSLGEKLINRASCELSMPHALAGNFAEPRIHLEWNPDWDGSEQDVVSILDMCRQYRFTASPTPIPTSLATARQSA